MRLLFSCRSCHRQDKASTSSWPGWNETGLGGCFSWLTQLDSGTTQGQGLVKNRFRSHISGTEIQSRVRTTSPPTRTVRSTRACTYCRIVQRSKNRAANAIHGQPIASAQIFLLHTTYHILCSSPKLPGKNKLPLAILTIASILFAPSSLDSRFSIVCTSGLGPRQASISASSLGSTPGISMGQAWPTILQGAGRRLIWTTQRRNLGPDEYQQDIGSECYTQS